MIIRLDKLGFAVKNVNQSRRVFRSLLGIDSFTEDCDLQVGITEAASIPMPNDCSIYLMGSDQPDSAVFQYLEKKGPGLERAIFITDNIQEDFSRVTKAGIKPFGNGLIQTNKGTRLIIPAEYMMGMTVEMFQPLQPIIFNGRPNNFGILGIQHIGMAVRDFKEAEKNFLTVLDIPITGVRTDQHGGEQKDGRIEPGNDHLIIHVTQSWGQNARVRQFIEDKGEGLEHICIEVEDIRKAVHRVKEFGFPINEGKIYTDRDDGFETFVYPPFTTGVTIEFIEPFPNSIGYRIRN